jgi:acetoin utilization deacetylase AcuC-like enzyme
MAINELRKKFDRICYIDLDLHHGDGKKFKKKVLFFLSILLQTFIRKILEIY